MATKIYDRVENLRIVGPHVKARSVDASAQTLVNWYLETFSAVKDKVLSGVLYPTPGSVFVKSIGLGPHRGAIIHKGKAYYVSGNELIEQDTSDTFTTVGTLNTNTGFVSMATNGAFGDQLVIVDGTDGYIWNGSTFTTIADADFPANPFQIRYMDSYFIVISTDSGQFNISTSNDGSSWDALDFANAERQPDDVLAIETLGRDIYFIGSETTEVWTNTGGRFPFEPYTNGVAEVGTASKWAVSKTDEAVVFVTSHERGRGRIVMMHGPQYKVISNPAVEYELSTYNTLSNAYSFIYEQAGHVFYVLTFPGEETTWVYDMSIGDPEYGWHKRTTNNKRFFGATHLFFNGKNYVGHYDSPELFYLDLDVYTDNGIAIKRERAGIHMQDTRQRFRYNKLELEFEGGVGLITGQGSDPKIMLDWSDDGGHTWSNVRYMSIGKIGEYKYRALAHTLGSARDRVFRVRASDPVKVVLLGGYAYVQELYD